MVLPNNLCRGLSVALALTVLSLAGVGCSQKKEVGRTYSNSESPRESTASKAEGAKFEVRCKVEYWAMGTGECSFMNVGGGVGSVCGVVQVKHFRGAVIKSDNMCSGRVLPNTVERQDFDVGNLLHGCSEGFLDNEEDHCFAEFTAH